MKKCFLLLLTFVFLYSTAALAVPTLEEGPIYFQFAGQEQLSTTGSITSPSGTFNETSWGIFTMSGLWQGNSEDQEFGQSIGNPIWQNTGGADSITGIFGGFEQDNSGTGTFDSQGGQLWLYYNENANPDVDGTLDPTLRWNDNNDFSYPGFTNGELLAAVEYVPGVIDNNTVTLTGSAQPTTSATGFSGDALAYGNVMDINDDGKITSIDGAWASYINTAFFETNRENADIFFQNSYSELPAWDGDSTESFYGDDVIGANFSDPGRAYGVPEPGTLLLFGTGLLGLAAFGRRKFMKKS